MHISENWEVVISQRFSSWFDEQPPLVQRRCIAALTLLERFGPTLPHPHSSAIHGVATIPLRELRFTAKGRAVRVLYAFDTRRRALVLVGGDKSGDSRWYERNIPRALREFERLSTDPTPTPLRTRDDLPR